MACEHIRINMGDHQFTGFICSRGYRPKTWQCECGKRNQKAALVCAKCGLYRDGCPTCDSDMIPAYNPATLWDEPQQVFTAGVKRRHVCSGNKSVTGKSCGHWVMA